VQTRMGSRYNQVHVTWPRTGQCGTIACAMRGDGTLQSGETDVVWRFGTVYFRRTEQTFADLI